jgi:hypothetical protein
VDEPVALERNLMETSVEPRERPRVAKRAPRPSPKVREHRRAVDVLEHKGVLLNLEHAGYGDPLRTRMTHDGRFPYRIAAILEPAKHAAVAQIEDLRRAARCDQAHRLNSGSDAR